MKFNKYVWSLYKSSSEGTQAISDSEPVKEFPHTEEFLLELDEEYIQEIKSSGFKNYLYQNKLNIYKIYHTYFKSKEFKIEEAEELFNRWISEGIIFNNFNFIESNQYDVWMDHIEIISNTLYASFPDFFFPYFFLHRFNEFQEICEEYEITLPEIPKKRDEKGRINYYIKICQALYEFRIFNELTPQECVAFIYDFSPKTISNINSYDSELPKPSKVWYVGAGKQDYSFLDNAQTEDESYWQCNIDTQPGDIILMYCWSPRSYIHSVWRATTNGFIDPFFYYYKLAYISKPKKVSPISFGTIKNNPILSKNPILSNNFQGVNGYPVTYEEYQEMLSIWEMNGINSDDLPEIDPIAGLPEEIILKDERDVELYLVEPFLKQLSFTNEDWVRQMPVRMGRGERNYPDYCFEANTKRGEESAKMILETKFSIKNNTVLKDAFYQAKSYAIRLQALKLIVAAREGVWIFSKIKEDFKPDQYKNYSWNDLKSPDKLHEVLMLVGKNHFKKYKD